MPQAGEKINGNARLYRAVQLKPCPCCGMDSGQRYVKRGDKEDRYYVKCQTCGWRTFYTADTRNASKAWNTTEKSRSCV